MKTKMLALAFVPAIVWAHEGHGIAGASHWHATDTLGYLAFAAALAFAAWWIRKK